VNLLDGWSENARGKEVSVRFKEEVRSGKSKAGSYNWKLILACPSSKRLDVEK
jgi:hypothetical protein